MVSFLRPAASSAMALAMAAMGFGLLGCDRLKTLVPAEKNSVASEFDAPAIPALAALVQRGDAGILLRKDLPLPARFKVNWERWDEMTDVRRIAYGTEAGRPSEAAREAIPERKFFSKASLQRVTPDHYTLTVPGIAAPEPVKKGEVAAPLPVMIAGEHLAASSVTLLRSQGLWSVAKPAGPLDFKALNWGDNLSPNFNALLRRSNLTTSPRWLGEPLVAAKQITLSGGDTAILLGCTSTGELVLRYVGEKTLRGHPCAAFSITGRYQTEPTLHWHGQYESEEMNIESGEVYLSLLYPIVIGLDINGILSLSTWAAAGGKGKPSSTLQGRTHRKLMAIPEFPEGWSPSPVLGSGS